MSKADVRFAALRTTSGRSGNGHVPPFCQLSALAIVAADSQSDPEELTPIVADFAPCFYSNLPWVLPIRYRSRQSRARATAINH